MELAKEAISECDCDIKIDNNQFVFNEYDAFDRISEVQKMKDLEKVETLYTQKFNIYLEQTAEKERLRIEEEKRILREAKAELLIANAKKQGYKLKKEIREDNTIKLVIQKRVY
jgi:ribulose 1,5-bisphosphate carboxylase large subunit-like protein